MYGSVYLMGRFFYAWSGSGHFGKGIWIALEKTTKLLESLNYEMEYISFFLEEKWKQLSLLLAWACNIYLFSENEASVNEHCKTSSTSHFLE